MIKRQNVGLGSFAYSRYQRVEIHRGRVSRKIPVPERHVVGGVLATHETGGTNAVPMPERERKQQQRSALGVVGNNDERDEALARSDPALPGAKKIEPLVGCGELLAIFEAAPDRLGMNKIVKDIDAGDAACFRPRLRVGHLAFDRGSHGHRKTCLQGIITFCDVADLCKERSTKRNDNSRGRGRWRQRGDRTFAI